MLIILEGCDGVGKTMFADQLESYLRETTSDVVTRLHSGPPSGDPLDEYVIPLLNYAPGVGEHIIIDRWHWGELVYPHVLNRASKFDLARRRYVEMFLAARGALLVEVRRNVDDIRTTLEDRLKEGKPDLITSAQVPDVIRCFSEVRSASIVSSAWIMPHTELTDLGVSLVLQAKHLEDDVEDVSMFTTYVGPPQPQTLLVGEDRNGNESHDGLAPAFMPYGGTSGHYLLKNLGRWWFEEPGRVALVNACDVDDIEAVVEKVKPIRIVTLGVKARRRCSSLDDSVAKGSVPHPQYIRRFHHADGRAYGQAIQDAAIFLKDSVSWRP